MDENRLPELPQEAFRPMIAQSVQLEQFLGKELIFCFRDLDGVHTFTTCYGDIYKTVNTAGLCPASGIGVRSVGADWIPSCYL